MITTLDNGTKVVLNGYGSVGVGVGMLGNEVIIGVCELEHRIPIGDNVLRHSDDQVILSFCNVNSIDVWIGKLMEAKEMLMK